MTNKNDPLDSEISGAITITEKSIEAKLKTRTTSALDRLCGSAFDYVNLKLEKRNSKERALIAAERAIIESAGKSVVDHIGTDPEYADRMIENHLRGIAQRQQNKDAIGQIAYDELKQLPLPDGTSMEDAPDSIDEDWLNRFEAIAETASTERMRQLFGKILSGEIRRPDAFSLTTLRVASELSQRTAQLFQELVVVRIDDTIVEFDVERDFGKFLDLEVAGLVNFDAGKLLRRLRPKTSNRVALVGAEMFATVELKNPDQELAYAMVRLTTIGHELATLVPKDELRAFKKVIELNKSYIVQVSLFKIERFADGNPVSNGVPFETLNFNSP